MTKTSTLRSAFALVRLRFVLQQIALLLFVFLLFDLWLHIPDASIVNVAESVLLALLIIAIAGATESWLVLRLCTAEPTRSRLLRGATFILLGALVYVAWSSLFNHTHPNDYLRAGYLNSRFPRGMRKFFSYEHLTLWQQWLRNTVQWIGTGIIASTVFAATTAPYPLRAILRTLRSITFWITLVFGSLAATALTTSLVAWTPGHGLRIETLSLILRLTTAALFDATIATLILCILAVRTRPTDSEKATPPA